MKITKDIIYLGLFFYQSQDRLVSLLHLTFVSFATYKPSLLNSTGLCCKQCLEMVWVWHIFKPLCVVLSTFENCMCSVLEYESKSANDMRLWIQISYDVWVVYLLLGNCLNAALWLVDSVYSVNDWFCEWKQSQCCVGYGSERLCYVLFTWRSINMWDTKLENGVGVIVLEPIRE